MARGEAALGAGPAALAFGISGAVDPEMGVVLLPGKFANLEGYPLVPKLREKSGFLLSPKTMGASRSSRKKIMARLASGNGPYA